METSLDVLTDIPCFKCLFWDWKKESHLYCNPNECKILTEWLLKEAESNKQIEGSLTVIVKQHKENPITKT